MTTPSDGGRIWMPRGQDPRIVEIIDASGITPIGSVNDDMRSALAALTGLEAERLSIDDLWKRWLIQEGITDTSDPFELPNVGGGTFPAVGGWTRGTQTVDATDWDTIQDAHDAHNLRHLNGFQYSADGIYLVTSTRGGGGGIFTWVLSTAFDPSTATQTGDINNNYTNPWQVGWTNEGNNIWVVDQAGSIHSIPLTTQWQILDANATGSSLTQVETGSDGTDGPLYMTFDGLHCVSVVDVLNVSTLRVDTLTNPGDLDNIASTSTISIETQIAVPGSMANNGIAISEDGLTVLYWSGAPKNMDHFQLNTAWTPADGYTATLDTTTFDFLASNPVMNMTPGNARMFLWNAVPALVDEYTQT